MERCYSFPNGNSCKWGFEIRNHQLHVNTHICICSLLSTLSDSISFSMWVVCSMPVITSCIYTVFDMIAKRLFKLCSISGFRGTKKRCCLLLVGASFYIYTCDTNSDFGDSYVYGSKVNWLSLLSVCNHEKHLRLLGCLIVSRFACSACYYRGTTLGYPGFDRLNFRNPNGATFSCLSRSTTLLWSCFIESMYWQAQELAGSGHIRTWTHHPM